MPRGNKASSNFKMPIPFMDVFAFAIAGIFIGFLNFSLFFLTLSNPFSNNLALEIGLYVPFLVFMITGFIFYIYIEYKFNRLKIKNIFLYLALVIILTNTLAVILLPSEIKILEETLVITPLQRVEHIFYAIPFALSPYIFFYLLPRRVLSRHHMNIALIIMLCFVLSTIILSPIFDWQRYISHEGLQSFLGHKNIFALVLTIGIFIAILLRIQTKKWWWSLFIILFYVFVILSQGKISLLVSTLCVVIYAAIRLVQICKKSKDNLVITLLIVGFCILLSPLLIAGIIRSETGVLASIRQFFEKAFNNANTTLHSRIVIWQSTLALLGSYRVIFGWGLSSFAPVLRMYNSQVTPYDFDLGIAASHNVVLELLGRGGIILLIIGILLYVYLIHAAVKLRKKNFWLSTATIIFIGLSLLISAFEVTSVCGIFGELFPTLAVVTPIMSEYYFYFDKDERAIRKDVVGNIKIIKHKQYKSKLLTLNKKRLIYEVKYIAYDLNSKIKL